MYSKNKFVLRVMTVLVIIALILPSGSIIADALAFQPVPYENTTTGRNSYAYNPATGHPTEIEKLAFVDELTTYGIAAKNQWQMPASAIIGMAIKESGYGYTRIAVNANNLFAMKIYGVNPSNAWQLKGQPYEGDGNPSLANVTSANYGTDRIVFKEWLREDNWYRIFNSRIDAVNYLAGTLMQNSRYRPALDSYLSRIAAGWTYRQASIQYVYDIAAAGYCSWGPVYYRDAVTSFMDMWDLYQYDAPQQDNVPWVSNIDVTPIGSGNKVTGTVTLSVTAGDDKGISKVEFYSNNGGYLISTDTTAPYSCNWVTDPYVPNGDQILKVIVYDTINQTAGVTRTVTVDNNAAPVVNSISVSPVGADGKTVSGDVIISATVSDSNGASDIQRVEFYSSNGGYLITTDTVAPYSCNWVTNPYVPNGDQTLKVKAYDLAGLSAELTRTVTVSN